LRVSGARSEPLASATDLGAENSEVSPLEASRFRERTVAVIVSPAGTAVAGENVKAALPDASVVTSFPPKNFSPSSPEGLEKRDA
jgi:hypothetical protein